MRASDTSVAPFGGESIAQRGDDAPQAGPARLGALAIGTVGGQQALQLSQLLPTSERRRVGPASSGALLDEPTPGHDASACPADQPRLDSIATRQGPVRR